MVILIISHIHLLREALAAALQGADDHEAFGASSHETVGTITVEFPPGLIIVDASHPQGTTLVAAVRAHLPQVKVVVLATRERDEDFLAWAESGISGYLGPDTSAREILAVVRRAKTGEVVCSPRLTALLLTRLSAGFSDRASWGSVHELTACERGIVEFLAMGLSNKRIARQLGVAVSTVKNHVHSILGKWNVSSRGEAAARYRQQAQADILLSDVKITGLRRRDLFQPGPPAWRNSEARAIGGSS